MNPIVELHGTGYWNDAVGRKLEQAAAESVVSYNAASKKFHQAIGKVAGFHENDDAIQYTSQQSRIAALRKEFHG